MITLGGGAESWSSSVISNPGNFLTFPSTTGGTGSGDLLIDYPVNMGVARTGELEFTTSGGTGPAATVRLTIMQLGAAPTITVTPGSFLSLAATSADQLTAVITLGGGAESWSSSVIMNPGNFLTFPSTTGGMGSGNLLIDYPVNMGVARTGELEFTTSGGTGPAATVRLTIMQLGAAPTITVTPSEYPDVVATPAGTIIPMIALGGGAEGWSAVLGANPGGFLTLPPINERCG